MIYYLNGKFVSKKENFIVIDVGGVGFRVCAPGIYKDLSSGADIKLFCYLYSRQDGSLELYGFLTEPELVLFEKLNSISGIGPKSALGVLSIAKVDQLIAAINEGKIDLLTRASGIGKKTAERIILELKGKLAAGKSAELVQAMESDADIVDALVNLGYSKETAKRAVSRIDSKITSFEQRFKAALKETR